jgi:hypothetical protein
MPVLAATVAIFMELPVAFAVAVGAFARSRVLRLCFWFYTRWELRSLGIDTGR